MTHPAPPCPLTVELTGSVAWFTLDRPNKYNALSRELNQALLDACRALPSAVGIVVLRGAGKHFCAGSDLNDLYRVSRAEAERVMRLEIDACHALAGLSQLTVAIVHGHCRGGGAILPLYCDLRIGCAGVEFSLPETSLGWVPPYGIERMRANFSRTFVLDYLISGRTCGDREALQAGWINLLMGADAAEAGAYVDRLARCPPRTLRDAIGLAGTKDLPRMRSADQEALEAFLNHFDTEPARRHVADFVEKRRR